MDACQAGGRRYQRSKKQPRVMKVKVCVPVVAGPGTRRHPCHVCHAVPCPCGLGLTYIYHFELTIRTPPV